MASDVNVRVQTLQRLADGYARLAKQLPGPTPPAHRKLMAEVFARLEELLQVLEGPTPGAEFRQQMEVIADAQSQLAAGATDLSPDPTIDSGLRAARDVLNSISHADYYDREELTPTLNQLTVKIDALDTARGPVHQVYVAEAVGISSQIISTMCRTLDQRLSQQNSTTAPASRPAPLKSSAPAPSSPR